MEKEWIYDKSPTDNYELEMNKVILKLTKNKELANNSARTLGLYKFLSTQRWKDPDEIYNSIFLDTGKKTHFFRKDDAKIIFKYLNTAEQNGGSEDFSKPYDALIMRWFNFIYYMSPDPIQSMVSSLEPFAFPLKTIEQDLPGIGDTIGISVDVAAETNKVLAKSSQQYTPIIMGFLPIPEASTVGLVIGYLISTIFIFFNIAIYVSRQHLGEAFTQSFALIPLAGIGLQSMAESGDKILEKVSMRRKRLIDKVKEVLPPFADILDKIIFDPEYQGDPKVDAEKWKMSISQISENIKGKIEELKSPEARASLLANTKSGIAKLGNIPELQEKIAEFNTPERRASLLANTKNSIQSFGKTLQGKQAGKRFSKIMSSKGKWKTQRKLKK